jgi:hypothetical protein
VLTSGGPKGRSVLTRRIAPCCEGPKGLSVLDYAHQRRDFTFGQGVVVAFVFCADHVFDAVAAAVYFAAGNLDGAEVLDDAYYGIEAVARRRVHAAYVLSLLEVFPAVAKDRHGRIVHWLDLDHIGAHDARAATVQAPAYRA